MSEKEKLREDGAITKSLSQTAELIMHIRQGVQLNRQYIGKLRGEFPSPENDAKKECRDVMTVEGIINRVNQELHEINQELALINKEAAVSI